MTLIIQKPTGAKLVLAKDFSFDADAAAYIAAVEAADTQALETATRYAINDFVIGCKQDGIWSAIKASCILAGARTLNGAMVPLVGTPPTNNSFVAGDYTRKTGLTGGTGRWLNSNFSETSLSQDSNHLSIYKTSAGSPSGTILIGAAAGPGPQLEIGRVGGSIGLYSRNNSSDFSQHGLAAEQSTGFKGISRNNSSGWLIRTDSSVSQKSGNSTGRGTTTIHVFSGAGGAGSTTATLAFYSIGESLNLALLDARVTNLINAFAAAIP